MVPDALRSLWAEPRLANPPGPVPRDWVLVAVLTCWSVLEGVLRQDMAPLPLLLIAALVAVAPLPWRRTHPLLVVAVTFGTLAVVDLVRILTGSHGVLPFGVSATLVLTYALFRWGSVREAAGGFAIIVLWLNLTLVAESTSVAKAE